MTTIEELDKKISEYTIESNELSNHKKILEQISKLKSIEKDSIEYVVNIDNWDKNIWDNKDKSWDIKYKRKSIYQFITEKVNALVIERKNDDVTKEFLLCFSGFLCREIERLKKLEEAQYGK